jgi:polysaccharide biosynthesis transport protein
MLGVVLNRVDLESPEYAYYSAYYYHYEGDREHHEHESAGPGKLAKAS